MTAHSHRRAGGCVTHDDRQLANDTAYKNIRALQPHIQVLLLTTLIVFTHLNQPLSLRSIMKCFVASVLLLAAVFALYTQSAAAQGDVATLTAQVCLIEYILARIDLLSLRTLSMTHQQQLEPAAMLHGSSAPSWR